MIYFTKMQAAGNDFVVIDARDNLLKISSEIAKKIADRKYGIGCDQVLIMERSLKADVKIRIYNADGSEAFACGNGARCVAWLCMEKYGSKSVRLETGDQILISTIAGDNRLFSKPISSSKVEGAYEAQNRSVLDIHEGHWGKSQIPPKPHEDSSIEATNKFAEEIELRKKSNIRPLYSGFSGLNYVAVNMGTLKINKELTETFQKEFEEKILFVSLGNNHIVFFDDFFKKKGIFEEKMKKNNKIAHYNVEFIHVINKHQIEANVFERGVGETLSCGSGAVASAFAAASLGHCSFPINVQMKGGVLTVDFAENREELVLSGPVVLVFTGQISKEILNNEF
ncbi:MAG: hypothetical protein LBS83_01470 [Holosporales bacterium]|jgi:diaminopimelate epimerase|nr:hypothetical protein [Holosporales bacterium]